MNFLNGSRGKTVDGIRTSQWYSSARIHRILRLIGLIPSALKWKIVDRPVFDSWVHPSGSVALLGDACHSILVDMSNPMRIDSFS